MCVETRSVILTVKSRDGFHMKLEKLIITYREFQRGTYMFLRQNKTKSDP